MWGERMWGQGSQCPAIDAIRGRHCHEDIVAVFELHALKEHDFKEHADESLRRMAEKMAGGEPLGMGGKVREGLATQQVQQQTGRPDGCGR